MSTSPETLRPAPSPGEVLDCCLWWPFVRDDGGLIVPFAAVAVGGDGLKDWLRLGSMASSRGSEEAAAVSCGPGSSHY